MSVCNTVGGVLPGVVSKISSRTAWYVDKVVLHLRDGGTSSHGLDGGIAQADEHLHATEHICAVEQMNHQVGNLGTTLIFHLSSGRVIRIAGSSGLRKWKTHEKLTVSAGEQIHSLEFAGSKLVGVWKAPTTETEIIEC